MTFRQVSSRVVQDRGCLGWFSKGATPLSEAQNDQFFNTSLVDRYDPVGPKTIKGRV